MQLIPQNQVFWYLNNPIKSEPLHQDIVTDIVIIGGGMAGLSAAQAFAQKGCKVVLIERNYCGAGASGKSSGFITPDSELSLFELEHMFGAQVGKKIWQLIGSGVDIIADNIKKYNLECDYQMQDTLILANTQRAFTADIKKEYDKRQQAGLLSVLYAQNEIQKVIDSDQYIGGISYSGTFGIHAYKYCLAMKKVLQEMGVQIFEDTPALIIEEKKVTTPHAVITANHIVVCTDHAQPAAQLLCNQIYHVQTFLMLSSPLSPVQVKQIFPAEPFMVWDTDMIYHYFRLTGDNRLMLGGSDILYTYAKKESYDCTRIAKKLMNYFSQKFPSVSLEFEYMWPGLIGISKDIFPIAGFDKKMPSVYYTAGACGLPFAAALGNYAANRIVDKKGEFDEYFSPERLFSLGPITQKILGTRLTFALSHFFQLQFR